MERAYRNVGYFLLALVPVFVIAAVVWIALGRRVQHWDGAVVSIGEPYVSFGC
jgi:hypothetical protein